MSAGRIEVNERRNYRKSDASTRVAETRAVTPHFGCPLRQGTVPSFLPTLHQKTIEDGGSRAGKRIACNGPKNQHDNRPSHPALIVFGRSLIPAALASRGVFWAGSVTEQGTLSGPRPPHHL